MRFLGYSLLPVVGEQEGECEMDSLFRELTGEGKTLHLKAKTTC